MQNFNPAYMKGWTDRQTYSVQMILLEPKFLGRRNNKVFLPLRYHSGLRAQAIVQDGITVTKNIKRTNKFGAILQIQGALVEFNESAWFKTTITIIIIILKLSNG